MKDRFGNVALYVGLTLSVTLLVACGGGGGGGGGPTPNPVPSIASLSPTSATAGGNGFTLTVNGSRFISSSTVRWNGTSRTTTFVNSGQLTAAITATDIATAGSASVTVSNPSPGGGISNASTFTVNRPISITTTSLPPSANGHDYHFVLASDGGTGAITWTITSGNLPFGLQLDASSGLISGTVAGVTSSFTVQATDSGVPLGVGVQNLSVTVASLGRNDNITACGSTDIATPISNGTLRASISPYGDVDTYTFTLTQTVSNLDIQTFAQRLDIGNNLVVRRDFLDTILELLDSSCTVIGVNDDITVSASASVQDSEITVGAIPFPPLPVCVGQNTLFNPPAPCADMTPPTSLPAGTYYIRIRDFRGDGRPDLVYDLTVSGVQ